MSTPQVGSSSSDSRSPPSLLKQVGSLVAASVLTGVLYVITGYLETPSSTPKFIGLTNVFTIILAVNLIGWLISSWQKTEKYYDLIGSGSYIIGTIYTLFRSKLFYDWSSTLWFRQLLISSLCLIWAIRLGSFLVARVFRHGEDRRFRAVKGHPLTFLPYWVGQVMWITLVGMPIYLVNLQAKTATIAVNDILHNNLRDAVGVNGFTIGLALFIVGFYLEARADHEKSVFKHQKQSGKTSTPWIDTGLWSTSRHPNYLGEIMMWSGIATFALDSLPSSLPLTIACLSSPFFLTLLLTCASGIPILESQAQKDWGDDPRYQAYVARTGVLLPYPIESTLRRVFPFIPTGIPRSQGKKSE